MKSGVSEAHDIDEVYDHPHIGDSKCRECPERAVKPSESGIEIETIAASMPCMRKNIRQVFETAKS